MANLIKMVKHREDGTSQTANVHPDEVRNYQKGNWVLVDSPPAARETPMSVEEVVDFVLATTPKRRRRSKADVGDDN